MALPQTPLEKAERRIAQAKRTGVSDLDLSGNQLTALPESLGQLTALRTLSLDSNQLTALPEGLGQLTALRELWLSSNKLTALPEILAKCTTLQELFLNDNRLTALPENLGQLTKLRELWINDNRLTTLPESLGQLTELTHLFLHDNPGLDIPLEELGPAIMDVYGPKRATPKPPREILEYYFRTRGLAKRPLNEAKLILVGRGGAGKTSLRKRLLSAKFDKGEDKTPGIQVTPWPLALGRREKVTLNVWDFGGQEIMHSTHQFFLTKRSLYVVVLNAREGKQDDNLDYWLQRIEAYGGGSPALVIVNKCAQHPLELDERRLRERFPFIREFLRTDCQTREGLTRLKAAIKRETDALPDLRTPFPVQWFGVKTRLGQMPEDCLNYGDYQRLCTEQKEADPGNQETLIGFLHDLGAVLHFRDVPRLNDLGVLKPAWATDGIYGLLNAKSVAAAGGVLAVNEMGTLLDAVKYPKHRHQFLLDLMEEFQLCFPLSGTKPQKYLIPELLPVGTPELPGWKDEAGLGFEYQYNVLPEGMLPRFIVRTHEMSAGADRLRWRGGVTLRHNNAEALVRADVQEKRVWMVLRGPGRQPRELLAIIRREFESIHGDIKGLVAEEKVPVPGYPQEKLDYRKLLVREANGKTTVEFEAGTESVELPLGKLLDNFEDRSSRQERATIIVQAGGKLFMPTEHHDYRHAHITNSVVGAHMKNVTNAIQQLPPERTDLREALEALKRHAEPLLIELPEDSKEAAAQYLEDFTKEAIKEKPRKPFLEMTSKGLIDAAQTVAKMAPPIVATVGALKGLLGY